MNKYDAAIAIIIMSAVTALLRFLPFLIFAGDRPTPKIITYLGRVLPTAIMGMLVVYCLKNVEFTSVHGFVPALIASVMTAGSYALKKNTLFSIILGTAVYMMLIRVM